jgi:HTH-type transcriptional regulator/antitoxin HigA
MVKLNEYFPQSVPHPGLTVAEKLNELGISLKELGIKTGLGESVITAILKGAKPVTADIAIQFEKVLKIPAHFWLNNQRKYDEWATEKNKKGTIKSNVLITKLPPVTSHSGGLRNAK